MTKSSNVYRTKNDRNKSWFHFILKCTHSFHFMAAIVYKDLKIIEVFAFTNKYYAVLMRAHIYLYKEQQKQQNTELWANGIKLKVDVLFTLWWKWVDRSNTCRNKSFLFYFFYFQYSHFPLRVCYQSDDSWNVVIYIINMLVNLTLWKRRCIISVILFHSIPFKRFLFLFLRNCHHTKAQVLHF